jgi:hypothetical protein
MLRRLSVLVVVGLSILVFVGAAQAHRPLTGHHARQVVALRGLSARSSDVAVYGYLRRLGVRLRHVVIQRGRHNYAGPRCPGSGWTCTASRTVVQLSASAASSNVYVCTGSASPGDSCVVLQANAKSQNTATCTQQDAAAAQSCLIIQSSGTGKNVASVTQQVTQSAAGSSASQGTSQTGYVYQCTTSGPNSASVAQSVAQSADAGTSTSVSQAQTSSQDYLIQQSGPPAGQTACPAPNPQAPPAFSQVCPNMTGSNSATASQSVTQSGLATSATSGAQSQNADLTGHVDQCSNSNSTYSDTQNESQKLRAAGAGVTEKQVGPMLAAGAGLRVHRSGDARSLQHVRCCSFQGNNPSDRCTIKQTTNQDANAWVDASEAVSSLGQTTGSCAANISATQNGLVSTASSSGGTVNSSLTCSNGICSSTPIPTRLTWTGDTAGDYHDPALLAAVLVRSDTNAPLANQPVVLAMGAEQCTARTDANGLASCTVTLADTPGSYQASAHFAGSGPLVASDGGATFTVGREQSAITYGGDVTGDFHDVAQLQGTLTEDGVTPLAGKQVVLSLGTQTCTATTDANGLAGCGIHVEQAPGNVAVGASFAGDTFYASSGSPQATFAITPEQTGVSYTGVTTGDYGDVAHLAGTLTEDGNPALPLAGRTLSFTLGSQSCAGTTDSSGAASCDLGVAQPVSGSPYPLVASFAGDGSYSASSDGPRTFAVTPEPVTLHYTGPTLLPTGQSVGFSGSVSDPEEGGAPTAGVGVSFTAGTQSCTATSSNGGSAGCSIAISQSAGPITISMSVTDPNYTLSGAAPSVQGTVFALLDRGAFVIGDKEAAPNGKVTFWGSQWSQANPMTGGSGPSSFKGFAPSLTPATTACSATSGWTSSGGNSPPPPSTVPAYMAVITASSITGTPSSPSIPSIVVVKTDPGYSGSPGGTGTGTIVGTLCP